MAKKKLNVKFLALVLGALGVGVAVLGLIVLVQFRNDPVRHVKRGDTLVAEAEASKDGDERNSLYDAARQQYVRAIGKKPGEMAYYDLAIDATTNIEPTSSNEARDLYFFLASLLAGKIEYTRDADIRAETTAQLLDNLDVMTFSVPRDRSGSGLRAHQYVADRLETIDAKFNRLGDDELDPRMKATVRGLMVSPSWRGAANASNSEWRDGVEEIEEAIALDPSYVPNQYGLLRGLLTRFESEVNTAPDRTIRRLLEGEGGLNERIAAAREAVRGPAPELDLIEFERDQILFLVGKAGDAPDAITSAPDPARLAAIADEIGDLADADIEAYELRDRLVELWWSIIEAANRKPKGNVDSEIQVAIGNLLVQELFRRTSEELANLRADDEIDLRSDYLALLFSGGGEVDDAAAMAKINDLIETSQSVRKVGANRYVSERVLQLALQKRFDLCFRRTNSSDSTAEDFQDLAEAYDAISKTYVDDDERDGDPRWHRVDLVYKARLSKDASDRARTEADADTARALLAESMRFATEAASAAREMEKPGSQIDLLAADAAMLVALKTGEVGTATRIFKSAVSTQGDFQDDVGVQARLVELLVLGGQFEEAEQRLQVLRGAVGASDLEDLERLARLEGMIQSRGSGKSIDELPGIESFNQARSARIAGDLAEFKRILQDLVEKEDVDSKVRVLGLLELAGLAEADGDFDEMKAYARRVLEIEPNQIRAMILMNSGADTTSFDRIRTVAESMYDDPQDIDVQQARTASSLLASPGLNSPEEIAELRQNFRELQERIEAAEPKRPMALEYMFEMSLAGADLAAATEYLDDLEEANGGPTLITVRHRAELALAGDDLDGAIALVEDSIEEEGFGSDGMRRLLGDLYERRGDRVEARRQFQEAFKQAPNRWRNALAYARALLADGEVLEALQALRAGRGTGRSNPDFRDTWLFVEIQAGNFETAIRERQQIFEIDLFDTKNAIELARLLAESPVGRESIVHASSNPRTGDVAGEPRFDQVAWSKLSRQERRSLQYEAREARLGEARKIFETMLENDPTAPEVVVGAIRFGQAHNDYDLGEPDELIVGATARLRERIAGETGGTKRKFEERLGRVLAEKGRLAFERGDLELADATFQEAIWLGYDDQGNADGPPRVEALTAIASMLGATDDLERASTYQAELLSRMEKGEIDRRLRRNIAARLAKQYVGIGRNDVAAEVAERYFDENSSNALELSVLGTIAFGQADLLRKGLGSETEGGLPDAVVERLDKASALYEAALSLDASNAEALLQQAVLAEYRWLYATKSAQPERFKEAVKAARRFLDNDQTQWGARLRLVRMILREEDSDDEDDRYQKSIAELRAHLELIPNSSQARRLLIQLLDQSGRRVDAIDLAQASLERDSTNREWALALGNLRRSNGEFAEAAALYGMLYEKTKQIGYLKLEVRSLLDWDEADGDGSGSAKVVALVQEYPRAFSGDPTLIGAYCVALADGGRRATGLKNFESSYRQLESASNGRADGERNRAMLSFWLPSLFPKTAEGAADLAAYVEQISGGNPTVADLLAVAGRWDDPDVADLDAAISTVRRAVAVDADDMGRARALQQLGVLLTSKGDCDKAFGAFERALELTTQDPQLLNNVAFLAAKCGGDLDVALARAQAAVAASKYRSEFRDTLGAVHLARARQETDSKVKEEAYRKARQELLVGSRLGDSASPLIQLAELELELDNPDAARKFLRRASDRLPDEPAADVQARIDELLAELKDR